MTRYPINYQYDRRSGSEHDGFAGDAEEARAVIVRLLIEADDETDETSVPVPRLMSTEAGTVERSRQDVERWWADEIAAGWAAPTQVYGGWVVEVSYWGVD